MAVLAAEVKGLQTRPKFIAGAKVHLKRLLISQMVDSIGECDPEVLAFAILRMCAHPTWNFVSRVHPDTFRGSSNFDDRALAAFRKIAQLPDDYAFSEEQLILLHLPIAQDVVRDVVSFSSNKKLENFRKEDICFPSLV